MYTLPTQAVVIPMWQTLVPWFRQRWQSGSLLKTTTLSWWSSGHKYQREKKKVSENYLNRSISILSDNYHLSMEEEMEMKGEYHWSHVCCTVITSGILNTTPFFPPFFFHFFQDGCGGVGGTSVEWWNYRHLSQRIYLRSRNMNKARGWACGGIKRKGSFHAARSLDSLLSGGCRGPITLLVDPIGTLGCRWPGCGRRQVPLSALISI